jgi:hypothetical protein
MKWRGGEDKVFWKCDEAAVVMGGAGEDLEVGQVAEGSVGSGHLCPRVYAATQLGVAIQIRTGER